MIKLNDVTNYCTSQKVIELAHFCKDKIKQDAENTYAFVYAGWNGMQFEDENDTRYLELNLAENEDHSIKISIYLDIFNVEEKVFNFDSIDDAITKWNTLF